MKCQKNNNHKIAQKMQKQVKINRCTHNADEILHKDWYFENKPTEILEVDNTICQIQNAMKSLIRLGEAEAKRRHLANMVLPPTAKKKPGKN